MQILPQRKQCLEVTGGRRTYQAAYDMPGLSTYIYSRHCDNCMNGGGEVHFLSSCASGRITRIMLADIVGSADVFKKLSCEMRQGLVRSINSIWQNRVVANVSDQFRKFADHGGFGTASVATFFAPTRSFVMCNIGNPPPLVYRASSRTWEALHGEPETKQVKDVEEIDGVYSVKEYRHIKTTLEVDDVIVIYGNGFSQSAFPGGNIVGHTRLIDALRDAPHSCPMARLDHLINLVQSSKRQRGELQPGDVEADSTIVVCKVTKSPVRMRDNLLAPFRLLKKVRDATSLA
ncbi:MAG: SpoIIE family protein phosphatase [Pirellulaceae bacterium]